MCACRCAQYRFECALEGEPGSGGLLEELFGFDHLGRVAQLHGDGLLDAVGHRLQVERLRRLHQLPDDFLQRPLRRHLQTTNELAQLQPFVCVCVCVSRVSCRVCRVRVAHFFVGVADLVAGVGYAGGLHQHRLHGFPVLAQKRLTQVDQELACVGHSTIPCMIQPTAIVRVSHVAHVSCRAHVRWCTLGQSLLAGRRADAEGVGLSDGVLQPRRADGRVIPLLGIRVCVRRRIPSIQSTFHS